MLDSGDVQNKTVQPRSIFERTLRGCGIVAVIAIGFIVIMAIIVAIVSSVTDSPETTSAEESPAPTSTDTPTSTLTPLATASNTDPPAASACPTSAEQDYFNELDRQIRGLGTLVTMLGEDLERAAQNPLLLADEVWLVGRDQDIHIISLRAEAISKLESTESAAKVSRAAQQLSQRVQTAMAHLKIGIKDSDDIALNNFSRVLDQSAGDAKHIRGLIDSWCVGR